MRTTSEYCSIGHPDCICDYVVSYLLDRYLENDPKVRFAMECQIKDNFVTLGGEVTSTDYIDDATIRKHVRDAVREIGYTEWNADCWGRDNTIDPSALNITIHVSKQSPDIARGVDADGWGDQGIMWGMAVSDDDTEMMPKDHYIAKRIGMELYEMANDRMINIGLDIKTQVTMEGGVVREVIVAAPMMSRLETKIIEGVVAKIVETYAPGSGARYGIIVNGTGAYVRHASQGDCGTTGRKLAVDFYGGNCRIGGGCPWGKDPTKADVTLNIYARILAQRMLEKMGCDRVYCAVSCCIGRREIDIVYFDEHMKEIASTTENRPAHEIIAELGLNAPVFAFKKRNGLFSYPREKAV